MNPDANTVWTFVYAMVVMVIGGLAFWSYYHRDTYWKAALTLGVVGMLAGLAIALVNGTLWLVAHDLGSRLNGHDTEIVSDVLSRRSWNGNYSTVVTIILAASIVLNFVPFKRD